MGADWLRTCLCSGYISLVNAAMFVIGLIVLAFAFWNIFKDPLSNPSWDSLRALGGVSTTKWVAFVAGPLIIVASCLGFQFARSRRRCLGICYLICIVLALLLEWVAITVTTGGAIAIIGHINKAAELFKAKQIKAEDYLKVEKAGKAVVIAKTFRSWGTRWNNPDNKKNDYVCSFVDSSGGVQQMQDTNDKCKAGEQKVACTGMENFAKVTTDYCKAKAGSEAHFKEVCSNCVDTWWDLWDMSKHDDNKVPDLEGKFKGDPGAAYCRCMARFMDTTKRHYASIKTATIIFGIIQVVLVVATIWLLWCGGEKEDPPPEIEMNLGQQPGYGGSNALMQTVICPAGAQAGQPVMVQTADGRMMQAIVPPGISPGMPFQIHA